MDAGRRTGTGTGGRRGAVNGSQKQQNLRIVIQHLFEMRDLPGGIDCITVEAAADVVVDAAGDHRRQRRCDGLLRLLTKGGQMAQVPQQPQGGSLWEFRGRAEAAVDGIDKIEQNLIDLRRSRRITGWIATGGGGLGEQACRSLRDTVGDLRKAGVICAPERGDLCQHRGKSRHAVTRSRRKIGATGERPAVGQEEDGHRPTARHAHDLQCRHVVMVDIGMLLAVELDRQEGGIDPVGDFGIGKGLAGHHMAPVTGGIARGQQNRPRQPPGEREGLRVPGLPGDRLVRMSEEIGRAGGGQAVAQDGLIGGHRGSLARIGVFRQTIRKRKPGRKG